MRSNYALTRVLVFLTLAFFLVNCEDEHFNRYEDPPWLGGSIIETLESEGNYNILLELMRKAGYEEAITKGLFTVFAATDSSYQAYFDSKGIASVDDVTDAQAFQLFTLNVLTTPRSRQQLVFDYLPWHGGWQEPKSEIGATLWRVQTRSKSDDYIDHVRYYSSFKDQDLKILGQEKFVPLLSTEFFSDFNGAPDGSDYTYFFPTTEWSGLQWYNANIVKSEVKCSNGFIYYLDRAVPEIPSIEEYLKDHQDRFGIYYDLIQRFAEYSFQEYDDNADKTKLYSKSYRTISNIVSEAGPSPGEPYQRRNSYSAFIPTDNVLQDYLNNTFLKTFESLDSVPEISLAFLAQSCLTSSFNLPSKIQRSFVNNYGDPIQMDVYNDVDDAILLSNGPLFAMNKYYPPRAFTSTVSPVFFNNTYTTFLFGINDAKMTASLTASSLEVTIFAPTNNGLEEGGIRYYKPRQQLEIQLEDGSWSPMTAEEAKSFVSDHVKTDNLIGEQIDFSGEGYTKMSSGNFIYYNNNEIQGGGNQEMGTVAKILSSEDGDNGKFYELDRAIVAPVRDPARFIGDNDDLSEFYNLLFKAGLADTVVDSETQIEYPELSFLLEHDFWTVFAPTNDAIQAASVPDSLDDLKQFLLYHFVMDDVIFDDGVLNGTFNSSRVDSIGVAETYYTPVTVNNASKNLSVTDKLGNTVRINHSDADNIVRYGVVHKINKVLLGQ